MDMQLYPCPFCEDPMHEFVATPEGCAQGDGKFWVVCDHCGAMGPTGSSVENAVACWNMRAIKAIHSEQFAALGREMHAMTTCVHGPSIPFDEQLRCVPSIWRSYLKELDALHLASTRPVAHLRAKTSVFDWGGFEVCNEENLNAFPVYRRAATP